jgi:hypothetical protein
MAAGVIYMVAVYSDRRDQRSEYQQVHAVCYYLTSRPHYLFFPSGSLVLWLVSESVSESVSQSVQSVSQ